MQAQKFINEAVKLLTEIDSLSEALKNLKAEAKTAELDVATLSAVAKAIVQAKCDEVIEKNQAVIDAIEEYRS
jgi:transcriptional/translational regulatory protein YebC/TACO1